MDNEWRGRLRKPDAATGLPGPVEWRDLARWATKVERVEIVFAGQCATAGEEDACSTAIGTQLSARIVDLFSGEADYGCAAAPGAAAHADPPERAMGRRWLAVAATALVTAYVALVVVPAAETSPAPIAGIAPSYGPKTVSPVPNAAAIIRRIWVPELDAGYDPQGLAVDHGAIYVSAYRSDSLGVRRGPCRVIRIDLETGGSTGYVDVPSPCGHAGGVAVGGDGMLYVADTHTLFATPDRACVRWGRAIPAVFARSRGYWRARCVDAGWDLAWHL